MSPETPWEAEARDTVYQGLKEAEKKGRKPMDRSRIPSSTGSTEQRALEGPPDKGEETITPEGYKDHDAELRDWGRAKRHSTHHIGLNIVSILAIVRGQYWGISSDPSQLHVLPQESPTQGGQ